MTVSSVLVVDDNGINRYILVHLLTNLGLKATEAENGAEAVSKVEAESFDLILMDVFMPVMDGFEATRRIRALGFEHLPIIAITSAATAGDTARLLESGMDGLLAKPIGPDDLTKMLARWLSLPGRAVDDTACHGLEPEVAKALEQTKEVDLAALLACAEGDASLAVEMLRYFVEVGGGLSEGLGQAIKARDTAQASRQLLALCQPCRDIAAEALAQEAHSIGLDIRRSDAQFDRVEAFHARLLAFLSATAAAVLV
jgi:CheY-like chemotaxis protein